MKIYIYSVIFFLLGYKAFGQEEGLSPFNRHFYGVSQTSPAVEFYKKELPVNDTLVIERYYNAQMKPVRVDKILLQQDLPVAEVREFYSPEGSLQKKIILNRLNDTRQSLYYNKESLYGQIEVHPRGVTKGYLLIEDDTISLDKNIFEPSLAVSVEAYQSFLSKNLTYPGSAQRKRIDGTVSLALKISAEGELVEIEVANPEEVDEALQKEALRVLKKYKGGFIPAKAFAGEPVDGWLYIPLRFKIS
jgi:TonB family protein